MAENIKVQLEDIIKTINISSCKSFYKNDPLYNLYKSSKKESRDTLNRHPRHGYKKEEKNSDDKITKLTPSQVFRMAITVGFFYNTARKVNNTES